MGFNVQGLVQKISGKPTSRGGTVYNVCVQDQQGNEGWYGFGYDAPVFAQGDEISSF